MTAPERAAPRPQGPPPAPDPIVLLARVRGGTAGLERLLSLLRRRAVDVRRIAATSVEGTTEVLLHLDAGTDADRARTELLGLVDVEDVHDVSPRRAPPRGRTQRGGEANA